jgi:hypothetical protein
MHTNDENRFFIVNQEQRDLEQGTFRQIETPLGFFRYSTPKLIFPFGLRQRSQVDDRHPRQPTCSDNLLRLTIKERKRCAQYFVTAHDFLNAFLQRGCVHWAV